MNKTELAEKAAQLSGLSKKDAAAATNAVFAAISDALAADEKVSIPGFGTFEVRERAAREGRNPATGETIQVSASKAPAFKAGKSLKELVNG